MRPNAEYRALRDIPGPGTFAFAFRAGHDVTEDQRANLNLVVGEDVTPLTDTAMQRPADDDDRAEWQNFAVVRGVALDEARNMDRAELISRVGNPPDDSNGAVPLVPADTDRKARWAEFAAHRIVLDSHGQVDLGTARSRANAVTKDTLVAAFGADGTDDLRNPFFAPVGAAQGPKGQILPEQNVPAAEVVGPQPDNTAEQAKAQTTRGRQAE